MTQKEIRRKLIGLHRELVRARLLALDAAYDHYTCESNSDEAVKAYEAGETALKQLKDLIHQIEEESA